MLPRSVLLATDFSREAGIALIAAARMAHQFRLRVLVVHVCEYPPTYHHRQPAQALVALTRRNAQKKISEVRGYLASNGIENESLVLNSGVAHREILGITETMSAPIVCLGFPRRGCLPRLVFGSTAELVYRQAACPVLSCGPLVTPPSEMLVPFKRLLCATDHRIESRWATDFALKLKAAVNGSLEIAHFGPEVSKDNPGAGNRHHPDCVGAAHNIKDLSFAQLHGDVREQLPAELRRTQADLLILGIQRAKPSMSHLPNLTSSVIADAGCPVVTVAAPVEMGQNESEGHGRQGTYATKSL